MYFARRSLILLLLIGILLTSCGAPSAVSSTPDLNATIAVGAQTMVAALFQTQTALAPVATNTAIPTVTSLPTGTALALPSPFPSSTQAILFYNTPTPTGTFYTSTPLSSSLAVGCNNLGLIESFRSPDGTLTPGQKFTQSWQVENNGTCDWVYLYHLVFVSGDQMGGSPGRLSKVIPPGKWTTLSVDLTAPKDNGTYNASWRFSDAGGTPFGATLGVSITVKKNPEPTNTVDAVQTAVAGTVIAQMTQTAAAQQTALSVGQTAIACQTALAAGAPPPCP